MKNKNMFILAGIILLLLYFNNNPMSTICSESQIYNAYRANNLDFVCGQQYATCRYMMTSDKKYNANPRYFPQPFDSCELRYQGSYRYYYCEGNMTSGENINFHVTYDSDGLNTDTEDYITLSIWGQSCVSPSPILSFDLPSYYTTSDYIITNVKVDGRGDGYVVHGLIKELNLQKDGYTSFGLAKLDFGKLGRGTYTLEVWGQDTSAITKTFEVKGVMQLTSSFEPMQSYNNIKGYIYLKDENSRGLGIYDVNNFDVKAHPSNSLQYFTFTCSYIGKDDILGGKWDCSGNTNNYLGNIIVDAIVKKDGYIDAVQHISISTYIPSLVIDASCDAINCPFPNSATLDDTKTFTFYIKNNNQLVDASTVSVKVTNPSRTMVDSDITSSVLKSGTGTYQFTYGPLSEVEAWTFKIFCTFPGADPQTIYAKVAVTKEEPPVLFNPWILIIPVAIVGVVLFLRRKK